MSTRDEILTYLAGHPRSTGAQISQGLHLGAADIRHHLARLLGEGRIQALPPQPDGRGRPARRFELAAASRPNNLGPLCAVLFDLLAGPAHAHSLEEAARALLPPPAESGTLTQRLNRLVHRLQELGYNPGWEARQGGPVVIFRNCPYAAIRENRPGLCQFDALLIGQSCGISAGPRELLAGGARQCLFELTLQP